MVCCSQSTTLYSNKMLLFKNAVIQEEYVDRTFCVLNIQKDGHAKEINIDLTTGLPTEKFS